MKIDTVTDEHGREYKLRPKLAAGGQGKLYRDETGKFLIKKLLTPQGGDARERLRSQIASVKRMPISDLPITRPLAMLREPELGYVMDYVDGMEPIKTLAFPKGGWLSWYSETGGLKGRLEVLFQCALALAKLHARGIVYGDISSNNVLYSWDGREARVYLIDVDNLAYETDFTVRIFTPFFGAPELVNTFLERDNGGRRHGVSTLTDAYSFGVLAFETLCSHHPLIGQMVDEGAPELQEDALAGRLPWVLDKYDKRNSWPEKEPLYQILLSKKLRDLFEKTFGEGLTTPKERPGLSKWADTLFRASQFVLTCQKCGWTYYQTAKTCPKCSASKPLNLLGTVRFWCLNSEDGKLYCHETFKTGAVFQARDEAVITRRLLGCDSGDPDAPLARITLTANERFALDVAPGVECWLNKGSGDRIRVNKRITNSPYAWSICFGSSRQYFELKLGNK